MAAYPTLTKAPSYPLEPDGVIEDVVLRNPMEDGYVQTRPRTTRARRTWGLNYRNLPDADIATLRTFEITTLVNGAGSFTWTHPLSGTTYTVQLTGPIKFSRPVVPLHADASFMIREV
jgi:hypothetical protein